MYSFVRTLAFPCDAWTHHTLATCDASFRRLSSKPFYLEFLNVVPITISCFFCYVLRAVSCLPVCSPARLSVGLSACLPRLPNTKSRATRIRFSQYRIQTL